MKLFSALEAVFAIIGLITVIGGSWWAIFVYAPTQQVNYSFVVPQKYNATHFTLGRPGYYRPDLGMTALPYTLKDWIWTGTILTFDVSYYIYQPEKTDAVNDSTFLVTISPESYVLVGHDLYTVQAIKKELKP